MSKPWNSTLNSVSPKGSKVKARDARVKARLMRKAAECYFGARGWPGCPSWVPDDRQALEHMHIHGKRTHKGGGKEIRFDTAYSIIGCWWHHNLHTEGSMLIYTEATEAGVARTFGWAHRKIQDTVPSEIID